MDKSNKYENMSIDMAQKQAKIEGQRLAKMRQAMFEAFSEASKKENEENSFYDISHGTHLEHLAEWQDKNRERQRNEELKSNSFDNSKSNREDKLRKFSDFSHTVKGGTDDYYSSDYYEETDSESVANQLNNLELSSNQVDVMDRRSFLVEDLSSDDMDAKEAGRHGARTFFSSLFSRKDKNYAGENYQVNQAYEDSHDNHDSQEDYDLRTVQSSKSDKHFGNNINDEEFNEFNKLDLAKGAKRRSGLRDKVYSIREKFFAEQFEEGDADLSYDEENAGKISDHRNNTDEYKNNNNNDGGEINFSQTLTEYMDDSNLDEASSDLSREESSNVAKIAIGSNLEPKYDNHVYNSSYKESDSEEQKNLDLNYPNSDELSENKERAEKADSVENINIVENVDSAENIETTDEDESKSRDVDKVEKYSENIHYDQDTETKPIDRNEIGVKKTESQETVDSIAKVDDINGDKDHQDLQKIVKAGSTIFKKKYSNFRNKITEKIHEQGDKNREKYKDFVQRNKEVREALEEEHSATLPEAEKQKNNSRIKRQNPQEIFLSRNEELSRRKELLKSRITFFVLVSAIVLMHMFYLIFKPAEIYSDSEKRPLNQLPAFTIDSILSGRFMQNFEKYANDQFPLRDKYLGLNNLMRRSLLEKDNGRVYFGKAGYLFNKVDINDDTTYYSNAEIIKELDEAKASGRFGDREIYLAISPNKETFLKGYLPSNVAVRNQSMYLNLLNKVCENIHYIDLSKRLIDAGAEGQTFYYTDHHWTTAGAFAATNAILEAMDKRLLYADRFEKNVVKDDFLGSLHAKTGSFLTKKDNIEIWKNKEVEIDPNSNLEVRNSSDQIIRTGLYEPMALDGDSPYDVFVGGEQDFLSFHTASSKKIKADSILIIKDSFADSVVPFLTESFGHIYLLDPRYSNESINTILSKYPDISKVLILMNFNSFSEEKSLYKIVD